MIEPLLCGIVLGLIPVTLVGLFVAAWNQYRRGSAPLGPREWGMFLEYIIWRADQADKNR